MVETSPESSTIKTFLRIGLQLLIAAAVIFFLVDNFEEFSQIRPDWRVLSLALLVCLGILLVRGIGFGLLFEVLSVPISALESLIIVGRGTLYNLVLPSRAGTLYLIHELRSRANAKYPKIIAFYTGTMLLQMAINLLLMLVGFLTLAGKNSGYANLFACMAMLFSVLVALVVAWRFRREEPEGSELKERSLVDHLLLCLHGSIRWRLLFFCIFEQLLIILALLFCFSAIGLNLSFAQILYLTGVRNIVMMLSISPGALGVAEVLFAYVGASLTLNESASASAAFLLRLGILVVSLLITFLPAAYHGRAFFRPAKGSDRELS